MIYFINTDFNEILKISGFIATEECLIAYTVLHLMLQIMPARSFTMPSRLATMCAFCGQTAAFP